MGGVDDEDSDEEDDEVEAGWVGLGKVVIV